MRFGVEITIMTSAEIGIGPSIRIVPVGRLYGEGIFISVIVFAFFLPGLPVFQ